LKRGEIWYAALAGPARARPVLLLTRDAAYRYRRSATVATITRTVHGFLGEVPVGQAEGLRYDSVVNLDEVYTVPISALERRMGEVSPAKMLQIEDALAYTLQLPPYDR